MDFFYFAPLGESTFIFVGQKKNTFRRAVKKIGVCGKKQDYSRTENEKSNNELRT